jgi:hypothetical protein
MRSAFVFALVGLLLPSVAGAGAASTDLRLVPNTIAFRDPAHGIAGTGSTACSYPGSTCARRGTISITSNGGRTWRVVLGTARPVVSVGFRAGTAWARLDDGENLRGRDGGRAWSPAVPPSLPVAPCPRAEVSSVVVTPHGRQWALCAWEAGAGSQGKAVYRLTATGWRRVAWTPFGPPGHAYGGLALYGYPQGIAMADNGFGLIWESRGTLYVTDDGGSHWRGLPKIAQPELDFGRSAAALPRGVGFVLLARGTQAPAARQKVRLLVTRDAGRTWHVVHHWS